MRKSIQICNVPEALHRRLKARAALEGISMSRYVLREVERALARPSRREWLETVAAQPEFAIDRSPADILREERTVR